MGVGTSRVKLHSSAIERLKAKTYFSEKELHQWHRHFIKDFPNGTINRKEFESLYQQLFPKGNPRELSRYLFNIFDHNKDGLVEFEEYIEALSTTSRGTLEEKLRWTFQLYDLNSDGFVTQDELLTLLRTVYDLTEHAVVLDPDEDSPEKRLEKILMVMEVDDEKGINEEEFIQGCKSDPEVVRALSLYDGLV